METLKPFYNSVYTKIKEPNYKLIGPVCGHYAIIHNLQVIRIEIEFNTKMNICRKRIYVENKIYEKTNFYQ